MCVCGPIRAHTFALVLGRREAAGVDVEREQEAKEAARLVQDGLGDLLRPCLVAQASPEECLIELVDGEVLEALILGDACVQLEIDGTRRVGLL
jgi:hypothetical protein